MRARFRLVVGIVAACLAVVILIFVVVRLFGTGFNGYNQVTTAHTISGPMAGTVVRTEVPQPGKTLWDWLQLLIIPLVLAVGALLFNLANSRTEQKVSSDKQRQDLLQVYLDRMSELQLKQKLRSPEAKPEVRDMAKVLTITVLTQLDARRIGYVFTFLWEAGLMSTTSNSSVVNLKNVDLIRVQWGRANLYHADLSLANLSHSNLSHADLRGVNLSIADLSHADLRGANLEGAILSEAKLDGAKLRGANLEGANLLGARDYTEKQLKKAKSLKGAIMPNGIIRS